MKKDTVFNIITIAISLIGVGIASYSLSISKKSENRQEQILANSMTSILVAAYDKENDSLTIKTTEETKKLQAGAFVFPRAFSLEPIEFHLPDNRINVWPIKKAVIKVLREEAYLLYKDDPKSFKNKIIIVDIPVPIYAEYQSTAGGDSVINKASYYMVFSCAYTNAFILDEEEYNKELNEMNMCIYQTLTHQGRTILEGFYLFKWPWESDERTAKRILEKRQEQILNGIEHDWSTVRLSSRRQANKAN